MGSAPGLRPLTGPLHVALGVPATRPMHLRGMRPGRLCCGGLPQGIVYFGFVLIWDMVLDFHT